MYDENFDQDARLDELSQLEQEAKSRGFEPVEEMQEYDEEAYLRYLDRQA